MTSPKSLIRAMSLLVVLAFSCVLGSPAQVSASTTTSLLDPATLPANTTEATYTYCTFGTTSFKMDFYRPTGWGPVPVVLQVHGGGWVFGNRANYVTPALVSAFMNKGIAFATIDYQLWNGRSAINDTACAVRYLRASASKLGLNGRVGALGQSAGGQLVSLLGTSDQSAGFDIGQYPEQSSRVRAVVDEWGPVIFDSGQLTRFPYLPDIFGTSDLAQLQQYAPLTYATPDDPHFLVIHGALDSTVPPYNSKSFVTGLNNVHIPVQLILVQNAEHYLVHVSGTPPVSPTVAQIRADIVSFFVSNLRN